MILIEEGANGQLRYGRYYTDLHLSQHLGEIEEFVRVLDQYDVRSYLEIGSKFGCSLWKVAQSLPLGSRVTAVDLPNGDSLTDLEACVDEINEVLHLEASLVVGDSRDAKVIQQVRARGPFDAVFIDANHTLPCVTHDWETYGPMARKIVAFHDINHSKPVKPGKMPIEVKKFWDDLKSREDHEDSDLGFIEIKMCEQHNGIGVVCFL